MLKRIRQNLQSKNAETRLRAVAKLEDIPSDEAFDLLLRTLDDESSRVRNRVVEALGYRKDPRVLDRLLLLFGAQQENEREVLVVSKADEKGQRSQSREIMTMVEPVVSSDILIEAVGRIGDARSGQALVRDDIDFSKMPNSAAIMCWALASVATNTRDPVMLLQIARRLVQVFPSEREFNLHLIGQLPWSEVEMLDVVSKLLSDSLAEIRCHAAVMLALHGDSRGANFLFTLLTQRETHNDQRNDERLKHMAVDALVTLGDRRVLDALIDLLGRRPPPEFAARALGTVLRRWEDTLSDQERQQLGAAVPTMIGYLKHGAVFLDIVEGARRIHSAAADQLMDIWLNDEVGDMFAPFISEGDPSRLSDSVTDWSLISRSHNTPGAKISSHPLMKRVAVPALKARYEYLRQRQADGSIGWIVAYIGWLGDPQALPFLYEELDRCKVDDPEDLYGEIVYAIANIGQPESGDILISCLREEGREAHHDLFKPIRDFVRHLRDDNVLANLLLAVEEEGYLQHEIIEAIGENGSFVGAPPLLRLLSESDADLAETITALGHIAVSNAENTTLVNEIVVHLEVLLTDNRKIHLGFLYPQATAPVSERAQIALRTIKAQDSRWRNAPSFN